MPDEVTIVLGPGWGALDSATTSVQRPKALRQLRNEIAREIRGVAELPDADAVRAEIARVQSRLGGEASGAGDMRRQHAERLEARLLEVAPARGELPDEVIALVGREREALIQLAGQILAHDA